MSLVENILEKDQNPIRSLALKMMVTTILMYLNETGEVDWIISETKVSEKEENERTVIIKGLLSGIRHKLIPLRVVCRIYRAETAGSVWEPCCIDLSTGSQSSYFDYLQDIDTGAYVVVDVTGRIKKQIKY